MEQNPIIKLMLLEAAGGISTEDALQYAKSNEFLSGIDENYVVEFIAFASLVMEKDIHAALFFLDFCLQIAHKKQVSNKIIAMILFYNGLCSYYLTKYDDALKLYKEAREVFVEENMQDKVADCDVNMAIIYEIRGECDDALRLYKEAQKVYMNVIKEVASCNMDMANIYERIAMCDDAFSLYKKEVYKKAQKVYMNGLHPIV